MCNAAADNYAHALTFVPDCYKNQKRCNKAVNTYPSTIQFVPEYYKTQEMCDKAVNTCFFYLSLFPIDTRLKKKYVIDVSEGPFMLIYCPNRCKTQKKKKKE